MRGLKPLIAFVLVLAGLGAYIYFVTWKKPNDQAPDTSEKVFKGVSAEQVNTLRVKNPAGDTTMVKKADEWQITSPTSVAADDAEANSMTSSLASATIDRVVEEKPADLKTYGLASPRIDVSFKLGNDKEFRHLLIGDKSPTGDLYAMRGDDTRVFLVPGSGEQTFGRSTFELRDKTVLRFDRDKVDRIDIESSDAKVKPIELVKNGTSWKVTKPVEAPADFAAGEGLVSRIRSLQMKSIAGEHPTPADLKSYGLDKPSLTVTVSMGSAHAALAVGGKAGENELYVRDVGTDTVVKAESLFADDMKKSVDEYRRKDVFEFRAFNATHVEITRDGQTAIFDKVKGPKDAMPDTWRRTSGRAADMDKTKMEGALAKLSDMRIASFLDSSDMKKTGLDKPSMTVVVKYDDGRGVKEERAIFSKVDTDVFLSRPGEPGAGKIDAVGYADAIKALDDLK